MRSKTPAEAEQAMSHLSSESRCQAFVDYVQSLYDQQKVTVIMLTFYTRMVIVQDKRIRALSILDNLDYIRCNTYKCSLLCRLSFIVVYRPTFFI